MFTGSEFKAYCDSLAIEHITKPTYNPRSNGQAERFVDTFKRALKKAKGFDTEEKNIQTFPMVERITPNQKFIACQDHVCKENTFSIQHVVAK